MRTDEHKTCVSNMLKDKTDPKHNDMLAHLGYNFTCSRCKYKAKHTRKGPPPR